MELQQVNINGKRIPSCRGTYCSEISRTRTGSWQMLHDVHSAHSEYHWQQRECFTRSISSVAAFSNQHNSCSLSRLSSLYFPQRTRTNSVTFQLQISCSRLFSGSVPPFTQITEGFTVLSPAYFPQEKWKWQNVSCLICSPLVQSSMAKMLIRAKSLGMTEL